MKRGIEVEFKVYDNLLYGKIIYMPEELRENLYFCYNSGHKKYELTSVIHPMLSGNRLYLWGENIKHDNYPFHCLYPSSVEANVTKNNLQKAIQAFNEQYCKEQILDDIEKEYLENVLRPLKVKDIEITKIEYINNTAFISISYRNILNNELDTINLPTFEKNNMYKNMELDRGYNLKELELFK